MRLVLFRFFAVLLAFTLIFFLLRVLPGDVLDAQVAQGSLSPRLAAEYRQQMGLDQPMLQQYASSLFGVIRGDFGISLTRGVPVSRLLEGALQSTFALAMMALVVASALGIALGALANNPNPTVSRVTNLSISILQAMPVYWVATWIVIGVGLLVSPDSPGLRSLYETQLPVLALGLTSSGGIARVTQSALRQAYESDAIRTAHAKGLPCRQVFARHAFRLALPPILTVMGLQAGFLLSGTVIIEIIFARPGVGRVLYEAVLSRDYPVIQAVVLLSSLLYVMINLVLDVVQSWTDPRIRSFA